MADHDAGVAEADEGKKQADTGTDAQAQALGHGFEDPLPEPACAQRHEQDARTEDGTKSGLPRVSHAQDHAVREERVHSHAGSERYGPVRPQPHDSRADRSGQDGCREDRAEVHAGIAQDQGIDDDDVRHGEERRRAGDDLLPDRRALFLQLEETVNSIHGARSDILPQLEGETAPFLEQFAVGRDGLECPCGFRPH